MQQPLERIQQLHPQPFVQFVRERLLAEGATSLWMGAVMAWLLVLTVTPISIWMLGPQSFPLVASVGVLAQFTVTILALRSAWSWQRIGVVVLIVAAMTWGAEFIGHSTGLPFGEYYYTSLLQPQMGGVPLVIPLAWMMMLGPAWAVARAIVKGRSRFALALMAGVAITAWDFYLDPQMVNKGLWVWLQPGGYFGIPWINYAGWVLTAGLVTWVVHPRDLPRMQLLMIYTLTWIFQAVGLGILWQQPGPALVGFIIMGGFCVWAWRKEYQAWSGTS